jgi:hypothetical protein
MHEALDAQLLKSVQFSVIFFMIEDDHEIDEINRRIYIAGFAS